MPTQPSTSTQYCWHSKSSFVTVLLIMIEFFKTLKLPGEFHVCVGDCVGDRDGAEVGLSDALCIILCINEQSE